MDNGLVINGVRHNLVNDTEGYDCEHCSMTDMCDKFALDYGSFCLATDLFGFDGVHFEIEQ